MGTRVGGEAACGAAGGGVVGGDVREYDQRRKLECGRPDGGGVAQVLWWTQAGVRKEMWRAVIGWARESRGELRLLRAWREKKRR
eukprot:953394-Prymnesium_polylepis.1